MCHALHKVVTFREKMRLADIRTALRDTSHNGFPVVRPSAVGDLFVGLVVRDHLMVLLMRATALGTTHNLHVPWQDLNRRFVSAPALQMLTGGVCKPVL